MSNEAYKGTVRLTVAQAIIRFLSNQYSERDGVEHRLIAGAFGIFGHGNVAGIGQALLQNEIAPAEGENPMPYIMPRNEQGAVHAAAAFAKTTNRLQTWMTTASIGPGSLNMVTGAALATTNRLPVLIFPSDQFATRVPDPVLQQLEDPTSLDVSVNDAFRPVSRFFDRINRPEQLIPSLLCAMRVLTDPAETGAVTIALPQDVQAEAYDWPVEFFDKRVWHVRRPPAERAALERAVREADIVVDATRVGMAPLESQSNVKEEWLRPGQAVVDTVYHPRETKLLALAAHAGATAIDGLGMLLWQAAIAEEIWLDVAMPVDRVREAVFGG